jgi:hypothetical protein
VNILDLVTKWTFKADHKPLEAIEHHLEKINSKLEFLRAAELVRGLYEMVERFSGLGEQLQSAAASAGLSVEELQKLQFAGSQSAVAAEDMNQSMARLTRTLYEAKQGSAEAKKSFEEAGISEAQIAGFKTGKDALAALADRMAAIKDPIQKQALAMQLLGRGSHNMVMFLSKGSAAMKAVGEEGAAMGAVLSGQDAQALADVEDALSAFFQVVKTFTAHVAATFAPVVQRMVEITMKLWKANRGLIETNLEKWAGKVAYAIGFVYGLFAAVIIRFRRFIDQHQELVDWGLKLGAALVTMALAGKALNSAFGVLNGMLDTASSLLSPQAIAIGVLTVALHDLWVLLNGGKFKDTWFSGFLEALKGNDGLVAKLLARFGWDPDVTSKNVVIGGSGAPKSLDPGFGSHWMNGSDMGFMTNPLPPLGAGGVSIQAPINMVINTSDPKTAAEQAVEKIDKFFDQKTREAQRSTKSPLKY